MAYEMCHFTKHPIRLVRLFEEEEKVFDEVGLGSELLTQVLALPRMQKIAFISSFDERFRKFGLPKVEEKYRGPVLLRKVQFRNKIVRSINQ